MLPYRGSLDRFAYRLHVHSVIFWLTSSALLVLAASPRIPEAQGEHFRSAFSVAEGNVGVGGAIQVSAGRVSGFEALLVDVYTKGFAKK